MAPEAQPISYEMLQDLLRSERRTNKLVPVPPRFWPDVRTYLDAVTAEFRAQQAEDPFSRKVMLLTDQVKNARHAAESLWALRERKIAMLALAHAKDRKRPDGLLPDEAQLYDRLVSTLDESRSRAYGAPLPAVPGPATALPPASPSGPAAGMPGPAHAEPGSTNPSGAGTLAPADAVHADAAHVTVPAAATQPPAPPPPSPPVVVPADTQQAEELVTIRALGDIPPFVGPDMQTYLLKAGDIASVPPTIAKLLEKRKKAAILEM